MKNANWNILGVIVAIVILCILLAATGCEDKPKLEVGQIWEDMPTGDPFTESFPIRRKIVALKNGYVQYRPIYETFEGELWSLGEGAFRSGGATLVPVIVETPPKDEPEPVVTQGPGELVIITTDPEPNIPPIWGKGELPADYITFFGDDNAARLNKAQNDLLNKHQAVIHGLDQTKDGKTVHINGLIDMVVNLERRVAALEVIDPNDGFVTIEKLRVYKDADSLYGWRLDVNNKVNEIIDRVNEVAK